MDDGDQQQRAWIDGTLYESSHFRAFLFDGGDALARLISERLYSKQEAVMNNPTATNRAGAVWRMKLNAPKFAN